MYFFSMLSTTFFSSVESLLVSAPVVAMTTSVKTPLATSTLAYLLSTIAWAAAASAKA